MHSFPYLILPFQMQNQFFRRRFNEIFKLSSSGTTICVNKANILSSKEIGGQELAYEINGHKTGYYYLINVEATTEAINEFNRLATLSEDVIRHIIIKL